MRHHVVTSDLLFCRGNLELFRIQMLFVARSIETCTDAMWLRGTHEILLHLFDRGIGNGQAELLFGNGESEPEVTPRMIAILCRESEI
jgi:hypothetical protein